MQMRARSRRGKSLATRKTSITVPTLNLRSNKIEMTDAEYQLLHCNRLFVVIPSSEVFVDNEDDARGSSWDDSVA
jgi:hypothetical protein